MFSLQYISINPSKISLYNRLFYDDGTNYKPTKSLLPTQNKHKGSLSAKSINRLRAKVNWLVFKSKKQTVTYPNGTVSTNFRLSFITLTLPTRQVHSDLEIKAVLNNFLTHLRKKYGMKDYIWKAELQRNHNIHFHITTNVFVNHTIIRQLWNHYLTPLGYINAYSNKFSKLSLYEYKRIRHKNAKRTGKGITDAEIEKSYQYGQETNWESPNSTDVKTVFRVNSLNAYLSKYLAKKLSKETMSKSTKKRLKSFGGKIWFCSRSLSRLKSVVMEVTNKMLLFLDYFYTCNSVKFSIFDFCQLFYFDLSKVPKQASSQLSKVLNQYISDTCKI